MFVSLRLVHIMNKPLIAVPDIDNSWAVRLSGGCTSSVLEVVETVIVNEYSGSNCNLQDDQVDYKSVFLNFFNKFTVLYFFPCFGFLKVQLKTDCM